MNDLPNMRERYERALAEVGEMKKALAERARSVADLEQRLMRQVGQGERRSSAAAAGPAESDLARAVAAADAEKALAQAEREKLDERERHIRKVERELAGLRMQLEKDWRNLTDATAPQPTPEAPRPDREPPPPTPLPQPPPEPDLEPAATRRSRSTKRR